MRRLLLAALLFVTPASAESLDPGLRDGLVTTEDRDCRLWVGGLTDLARDVRVRWRGACVDGVATDTGRATILWREGIAAERGMAFTGTLLHGKPEGQGILIHFRNRDPTIIESGRFADGVLVEGRVGVAIEGLTYDGALRDGLPHGWGRLTGKDVVAQGTWDRGCLALPDGAWLGFLVPAGGCGAR